MAESDEGQAITLTVTDTAVGGGTTTASPFTFAVVDISPTLTTPVISGTAPPTRLVHTH